MSAPDVALAYDDAWTSCSRSISECVAVVDGKIARSRFVFDLLPFQALLEAPRPKPVNAGEYRGPANVVYEQR